MTGIDHFCAFENDVDEEYVNGVIQRLLETHCSEPEPEPQPPPQPATVAVSMPLANIEQGNPGPNQ